VLDPPNLATVMLSAPAGAGLLRTFLVEAGLGAAVETATLPSVAGWKRDIGVEFTAGDMVENVASGAVGAGGLGVGVKLIGRGLGALSDAWRAARQAGAVPDTTETRAAATVVETARDITEQSPFEDSVEGQAAHLAAMAEAEKAFNEGRMPDVEAEVAHAPPAWRRDFDPTDPVGSTQAFVDEVNAAPAKKLAMDYGEVSAHSVELAESAGVDVKRWRRIIDTSAVRHIDIGHGAPEEALRGQEPITAEGLARIPEIIERAQSIKLEKGSNPNAQDNFRYDVKMPDGTYFYVEEIRTGRQVLAVKTLFKKKGGPPAMDASSPSGTPPPQRPEPSGSAARTSIANKGGHDTKKGDTILITKKGGQNIN